MIKNNNIADTLTSKQQEINKYFSKETQLDLNPLAVMKYLVCEKGEISNLWCQKIIYFAYKKAILEYNIYPFKDQFEAWTYGPVLRSCYDLYKNYQDDNTASTLKEFFLKYYEDLKLTFSEKNKQHFYLFISFVDEFFQKLKNYTTIKLLLEGHDEYWEKSWNRSPNSKIILK